MNEGVILQIVSMVAVAGGIYAAIKSDLTRAIMLAEQAVKAAESAHHRMDKHLDESKYHGIQ